MSTVPGAAHRPTLAKHISSQPRNIEWSIGKSTNCVCALSINSDDKHLMVRNGIHRILFIYSELNNIQHICVLAAWF